MAHWAYMCLVLLIFLIDVPDDDNDNDGDDEDDAGIIRLSGPTCAWCC